MIAEKRKLFISFLFSRPIFGQIECASWFAQKISQAALQSSQSFMGRSLHDCFHICTDWRNKRHCIHLKHLFDVETCLYCPQAFLSLDLQCTNDVSERKLISLWLYNLSEAALCCRLELMMMGMQSG